MKVVMRSIGHKMLLLSGDSTSRVLPVEKSDSTYLISFAAPFSFDPRQMVASIEEVVEASGLAKSYLVEVREKGVKEAVYSYEMGLGPVKANFIPCMGRAHPKGQYSIAFTPFDPKEELEAGLEKAKIQESPKGLVPYKQLSLLGIPLLLAGLALFNRRKKKETPDAPIPPTLTTTEETDLLNLGSYEFNTRTLKLNRNGDTTELTGKEAELLMVLHTHVNETMEREQLLKEVWGDEGDYIGRTLDVFISKLRKRLDEDTSVNIKNIRGVGYRLVIES